MLVYVRLKKGIVQSTFWILKDLELPHPTLCRTFLRLYSKKNKNICYFENVFCLLHFFLQFETLVLIYIVTLYLYLRLVHLPEIQDIIILCSKVQFDLKFWTQKNSFSDVCTAITVAMNLAWTSAASISSIFVFRLKPSTSLAWWSRALSQNIWKVKKAR